MAISGQVNKLFRITWWLRRDPTQAKTHYYKIKIQPTAYKKQVLY